ncbi:hypothetical protein EZV62_001904 [Acer yangbiense]|uniref:DDE Tnp4 domain-containing protein n=1 Tax=Acer yangbiense TaxID=1000413 RepID=A0A5C7IVT9_9ROSI|nr:hypothetical protein EZV62_001904 [Acer yangbiense]
MKGGKGALDGTYIRVHVPEVSKPRFRTRKGEIATNILGACSKDMLLTFVFPGWKGSTSDSKILRDTLSRPTGLKVSTANGGHADCGSFKAETLKNIELRTTYTPESLAADLEEDGNFGNEFEMPTRNFSLMSVNQTDSNQQMNQASSQPVSRKRSRSGDPIVRSMDRFTNVINDAIDKSTDTLDKMCQVLTKSKMNENRVIANDLQNMRLPLSNQILVMQKFMQKSKIVEIFKAQQDEEQKLQLVASLLSDNFDV